MAVAEPNNELWTAVKAISNPWPPDNEDQVKKLAGDWRRAAQTAQLGGTELNESRRAAQQAWQDQAGQLMGEKIGNGAVALESQRRNAEQQAGRADQYAKALTDVKNAIVHNINLNLPTYLQLGNPMYGAAGAARQQQFAADVAAKLQALVAGQAVNAQAPPAANPPPPPPKNEGLLEKAGDVAGAVSAVAGRLALIPGLQVFAAPIALLSGGAALGLHLADMVATGEYGDKWVDVLGDVVGLFPGARAMREVMETGAIVVQGKDVVGSALDIGLQVPSVKDIMGAGDEINEQNKDMATATGLGKNVAVEVLERVSR
ncbi:hypothetical protein AB0J86_13070 [Micromonospora sp. NPDC049559]|uniref:WXG100-like domain-containing protein n=1 Tax=Micromonospora sp. NPDC049559 TaxID=3155923 RepID=UPI0034374B97